jgi:hypothetical protein
MKDTGLVTLIPGATDWLGTSIWEESADGVPADNIQAARKVAARAGPGGLERTIVKIKLSTSRVHTNSLVAVVVCELAG